MDDLNEIANVEAECFPAAEAATKEEFAGRIRYYGNHFWIMLEEEMCIRDRHKTEIDWVDGRKVAMCTLYDITEKKIYQKEIENQANNYFLRCV